MQRTLVPGATTISGVLKCTIWRPGQAPVECEPTELAADDVRWIELPANPELADDLISELQPLCRGLTVEMLQDLLTPDEEPEGSSYDDGQIRLASTFSVEPRRLTPQSKRGEAESAGVLIFQPVELIAAEKWLLTCWHPKRVFSGAETVAERESGSSQDIIADLVSQWETSSCHNAGDLGVLVMHQLALSYANAYWSLFAWHEDWELSLYMEDDLDNPEELPRLWGSMAVLRDWLKPLNRPGLQEHLERAWLPATQHDQVKAVDNRIDKALAKLSELAKTMRASFSVLHVSLAEEQRERRETIQRRVEVLAALFLVPTLVVGFYGANTWVPGQQAHWGFWVMVGALAILSAFAVAIVWNWQRVQDAKTEHNVAERQSQRDDLIRAL